MININLLEEQRKKIVKRDAKMAVRNKASLTILLVSILIFGAFQGFRAWYAFQINQVETELNRQKKVLVSYGEVENEGLIVADKLNEISKLISGRDSTREKLEVVFNVFDRGSILKQVGFGGVTDSGGLNVTGSAKGIFAYIDFDERLKALAQQEDFESLNLATLSRSEKGEYNFNYEITIAPTKKPSTKGATGAK